MTRQSDTTFSEGVLVDEGIQQKTHGFYSFSGHERNHLFLNFSKNDDASQRKFADVSAVSGLDSDADGRSFAVVDFDRDGDQDIALVNANAPAFQLFRNNTTESETAGNFIAVRLIGGATPTTHQGWTNRSAIGTRIVARIGNRNLVRELRAGEGYGAQNSSTVLIGIDSADQADVQIQWPSGRSQQIAGVAAGERIDVFENPAENQGNAIVRSRYEDATSKMAKSLAKIEKLKSELPESTETHDLTVLVTMATWCDSTKRSIPDFQELVTRFQNDSVCFIGIPTDQTDDATKLQEFQAKHAPAYKIFAQRDQELVDELTQVVLDATRVDALPTTILLRPDRSVAKVITGVPTFSDIQKHLVESRTHQATIALH